MSILELELQAREKFASRVSLTVCEFVSLAVGRDDPIAPNKPVGRDDPIAPDEFKKVLPTKAQLAKCVFAAEKQIEILNVGMGNGERGLGEGLR